MPATNSLSLHVWTGTGERVTTRKIERVSDRVDIGTRVAHRIAHRVAGRLMALMGSFNILIGTAIASKRHTALGHRQRVIGVLQSNCEVDRRAANAFIDRWMSKHPGLQAQ